MCTEDSRFLVQTVSKKLSIRGIKINFPFSWKKCYQTHDLPTIQPIPFPK